MQAWYLNDDAVVRQALYEGVVHAIDYQVAVIVVHLVVHIHHGCLNRSHLVAQKVDGNHGQRMHAAPAARHVAFMAVLEAQVLAEAQHLRLHPCLLHLYEDGLPLSLLVYHGSPEVDAVDREVVGEFVVVLVVAHVHLHHLLLQQGREDGTGYALVLHEVLEHNVVNRICYFHNYMVLSDV